MSPSWISCFPQGTGTLDSKVNAHQAGARTRLPAGQLPPLGVRHDYHPGGSSSCSARSSSPWPGRSARPGCACCWPARGAPPAAAAPPAADCVSPARRRPLSAGIATTSPASARRPARTRQAPRATARPSAVPIQAQTRIQAQTTAAGAACTYSGTGPLPAGRRRTRRTAARPGRPRCPRRYARPVGQRTSGCRPRRWRLRGREQPCRAGGRRERTGADLLAGCDAAGSVRSEVRGLDVARCLPAGRCRAVLSHLSDRQGSPAGRGGEKGLRRLRRPRELPVLRPGDHAGGHLERNHCGRATRSTQGIPRPGQRAVPRRAKRGGDRRTRGSDRARGRAAGHVRQDRVMSLPGRPAAGTEPDRENTGGRRSPPRAAVRFLYQAGRPRADARD